MPSDVCVLSVTFIGHKSRTERPRKTKSGTEVAHVTRESDTIFKVKRSRSPGHFTHCSVYASGSCSSDHVNSGNLLLHCGQTWSAPRFGAHIRRRGHIVVAPTQLVTTATDKTNRMWLQCFGMSQSEGVKWFLNGTPAYEMPFSAIQML